MSSACQNSGTQAPKKYLVSGTVTLDGKPLNEKGLIYFKTIATGSLDVFDVDAGKYRGSTEAGDRRVEIYVFHIEKKNIDGMKSEVKHNIIPARYNLESNLLAKVVPSGPNQFNYELMSK